MIYFSESQKTSYQKFFWIKLLLYAKLYYNKIL